MNQAVGSWIFLCVSSLLLTASATADSLIPLAYRQVAHEYRVPVRLLYAVALTESRQRLHDGDTRPWPWTLNVQGTSERYPSRAAAWQALERHLAAGRRSIDIGLMQINWRWHEPTLYSPWVALDPLFNLRLGAYLLRREYDRCGDWLTAAGRYHAPNKTHYAARYRRQVSGFVERLGGLE